MNPWVGLSSVSQGEDFKTKVEAPFSSTDKGGTTGTVGKCFTLYKLAETNQRILFLYL